MSDGALSIGLFFGSTTCYTEMAAEKIQAQLNSLFDDNVVELHNIKDVNLSRTADYDIIISVSYTHLTLPTSDLV